MTTFILDKHKRHVLNLEVIKMDSFYEANILFEKLGITIFKEDGNIRDLEDILTDLSEVWDKLL